MVKVFRRKADPAPQPPDTIAIELSHDEAVLLRTLLDHIGGSPTDSTAPTVALNLTTRFYAQNSELSRATRDLCNSLVNALCSVGVAPRLR